MAALVIDGGSWYQAAAPAADRRRRRRTRRRAGAAAEPVGGANRPRSDYAQQNYAGITAPTVTFPDAGDDRRRRDGGRRRDLRPDLGAVFDDVTVRAHAQAGVFAPEKLKNVAPIAIHKDYACIVSTRPASARR